MCDHTEIIVARGVTYCTQCCCTVEATEEIVEKDCCKAPCVRATTHSEVCVNCGTEVQAFDTSSVQYVYPRGHEIQVKNKQPYARSKRFAKYLARAGREQSLSSIPNETWRYLIDHLPYTGPGDILFTLKRSHLRTKCYDSLPLLTKSLCKCSVPMLSGRETDRAMVEFNQIENTFPRGSKFVSYLYLLEYILVLIGRSDILPFLNRIQCTKRRKMYDERITSYAAR